MGCGRPGLGLQAARGKTNQPWILDHRCEIISSTPSTFKFWHDAEHFFRTDIDLGLREYQHPKPNNHGSSNSFFSSVQTEAKSGDDDDDGDEEEAEIEDVDVYVVDDDGDVMM